MTLGDQTGPSDLRRLLGVAFPGEKEREEWEREQEEARRRDHRRIGTVSTPKKKVVSIKLDVSLTNPLSSCVCSGPGAVLLPRCESRQLLLPSQRSPHLQHPH